MGSLCYGVAGQKAYPASRIAMSWYHGLLDWLQNSGPAGGPVLAASVAVFLFFCTRLFEILAGFVSVRSTRKRLVIGLFSEVRTNVETIEKFLQASPHPGVAFEKVKNDKNFRPLIITGQTDHFFRSVIASIPDIDAVSLIAVSEFYENIQTAIRIASAFESQAFPTLSPEGRASTLDDLWNSLRKAEKLGWQAMYELELAYPRKWIKEFRALRSRRS